METSKLINYSLRPNKNIERKIIADLLQLLEADFRLSLYRYIGFGSMWFSDFVLFHKSLRIRDMVSIQAGREHAARANFNRPFESIIVREGQSTEVLPDLRYDDKPIMLWLDYDSGLSGPLFNDIEILAEKLKPADIYLATVNTNLRQLRKFGSGGIKRDERDVLAELLNVPRVKIPDDAIENGGMQAFVAKTLFAKIDSAIRKNSGGLRRFAPICNFAYADQASMLTVGGMVVDEREAMRLAASPLHAYPLASGSDQIEIAVPLLTHREKLLFDRNVGMLTGPRNHLFKRLGFTEEELDAYSTYYSFYPAFAEFNPV